MAVTEVAKLAASVPRNKAAGQKKLVGQRLEPEEVNKIIKERRERAQAKKSVPGIKQPHTTKRKGLKIDTIPKRLPHVD